MMKSRVKNRMFIYLTNGVLLVLFGTPVFHSGFSDAASRRLNTYSLARSCFASTLAAIAMSLIRYNHTVMFA